MEMELEMEMEMVWYRLWKDWLEMSHKFSSSILSQPSTAADSFVASFKLQAQPTPRKRQRESELEKQFIKIQKDNHL